MEINQQLSNVPILKWKAKDNKENKKDEKPVAVEETKTVEEEKKEISMKDDTLLTAEQIACGNGKIHIVLPNRRGGLFYDISVIERSFLYGSELLKVDIEDEILTALIGKEITVQSDKWAFHNAEFKPNGFKIIRLQNAKICSIREFDKTDTPVYFTVENKIAEIPSIAFIVTDSEANKINQIKPSVITAGGFLNVIYNPLKNKDTKIIQLHRFLFK